MKISELPHHHAVLILHNDRGTLAASLFKELQGNSPVHQFFNQTVLDMETARTIISWVNTPYNDEKIALVSFHTIGLEAQNALLKILEEPRAGVRFILITSNKANLIETLLSRVLLVNIANNESSNEVAKVFLKSNPVSRIKLPEITKLLSQVDEEERKDREAVRSFVLSLLPLIKKGKASKYKKEILEIASYAADPSASGKALLEYLALLLPQIEV